MHCKVFINSQTPSLGNTALQSGSWALTSVHFFHFFTVGGKQTFRDPALHLRWMLQSDWTGGFSFNSSGSLSAHPEPIQDSQCLRFSTNINRGLSLRYRWKDQGPMERGFLFIRLWGLVNTCTHTATTVVDMGGQRSVFGRSQTVM